MDELVSETLRVLTNVEAVDKILLDGDVLRWSAGDSSFIKGKSCVERQKCENAWLNEKIGMANGSGKLGERIANALLSVLGDKVLPGKRIKHYDVNDSRCLIPDAETDTHIIEIKTQTYFTPGTAGEKILAAPRKYNWVPRVSTKKVMIICIAHAEEIARRAKLFHGESEAPEDHQYHQLETQQGIEFIAGSDLLKRIIVRFKSEVPKPMPLESSTPVAPQCPPQIKRKTRRTANPCLSG